MRESEIHKSKENESEEYQEASKTSVKLIEKLNDSLETANQDLKIQEEANVILKDQNILLTSRFNDVEELVTKAQEDVKKRDKVITDLKKTQKCNHLTQPSTKHADITWQEIVDMVTSVKMGTHK